MKAPIRTTIDREGQPYFDEAVHTETKALPLVAELAEAFGRKFDPVIRNLDHYKRVPLRWMTPDANGKLVPKK